ncbi:MAG: beta-Ala-His dipeptidase [Blautia sp.]
MILEELLQDKIFRNFYAISQIPRRSYHEKQISDYLVKWAQEKNLYVLQDEHMNVLIRKMASVGYEKTKGVILQAHMDMVCEKVPESNHDFTKDAIPWVIEEDYLTTGGETTLGADDGIGMALAMAVLEENSWKHPLIEVVFTVAEEEDLSGAAGFDTSLLEGEYLINLDHVNDHEILCGSCGGEALEVLIPVQWEEIGEDCKVYDINIKGLKGGHSGEDIHRGYGNANKILARVLMELEKYMDVKMCSLEGGTFRLAIPREAKCVIALPESKVEKAEKIVSNINQRIREEYQSAGELFQMSFSVCEDACKKSCDADKLITLLLLSPDGILEMNPDIENLVNSSSNLGEVYLNEEGYRAVYEIRSAHDSARDHIADVIGRLAGMLGGQWEIHSSYPGWAYNPRSAFRILVAEIYQEINQSKPKIYGIHAGLECGYFFETKPNLDAVSIGPDCMGLHSPEEKVSISSTKKIYRILELILEKLCESKKI